MYDQRLGYHAASVNKNKFLHPCRRHGYSWLKLPCLSQAKSLKYVFLHFFLVYIGVNPVSCYNALRQVMNQVALQPVEILETSTHCHNVYYFKSFFYGP